MLKGVCYSSKSVSPLVSNRDNVAPGQFEIPVFSWKLQVPGPPVGSVHRVGHSYVSAAASAPGAAAKHCLGHEVQLRHPSGVKLGQVTSGLNLICSWKN